MFERVANHVQHVKFGNHKLFWSFLLQDVLAKWLGNLDFDDKKVKACDTYQRFYCLSTKVQKDYIIKYATKSKLLFLRARQYARLEMNVQEDFMIIMKTLVNFSFDCFLCKLSYCALYEDDKIYLAWETTLNLKFFIKTFEGF